MYWHKPYLTAEEKRGRLGWLDKLPRQEVTADDIKFTFDIVRDPLSECGPLASYLGDLDRVDVIDRYTVRFVWKRSLYYNKNNTLNLLMIYPKFIYERDENGDKLDDDLVASTYPQHWFNNKMCGTGPFQFAGFEPNQYIRLRRNADWWNPDGPVLDGIDLAIVTERSVQLAKFKAGEIDVLHANPADYRAEVLEGGAGSVKEMVENGTAEVKTWQMFAYYYVGWNMRLPQLREREVRRALAHLYPKDRIMRDLYYGLAIPCNGPVHPWESQYVKDLEQFPFDPAKAADMLDAAGWKLGEGAVRSKIVDGKRVELRLKLLYPANSTVARNATLLYQKSAARAGVILEDFPREWSAMTKMLEDKEFEACMLGWGNSWDSDPSQIWHSDSARSAKGSNTVSYMNPKIDRIIEGLKT